MPVVFIDESGDHNLNPVKLDNIYNVFVLGAVYFEDADYEVFDRKFRDLKIEFFGGDDLIIHTQEMTRPSKSKDSRNMFFNDAERRKLFYDKMNTLIADTPFSIMVSVLRKDAITNEHAMYSEDPYLYCFEAILNQILHKSKHQNIRIYPEKRTSTEDIKLEAEMLKLKVTGTRYYRGAEINRMISEFVLRDKKLNHSGLQLADLIVTPIGRHIIGKAPKPVGNEISYAMLKEKIGENDFLLFP